MLLDLVHDVDGLLPGVFGPGDLGLQLFSQFRWDHKLLSVWPFLKIPLNPPLKKGDFHSRALVPPFSKGGLGGILAWFIDLHRSISGMMKSMEPIMAIKSESKCPTAINGMAWTWAKPGERKRRR